MLVWAVVMMVGVAGFVAFLVWLVRSGQGGTGIAGQGPSNDPRHNARRILAERYARGDITTDEYEERLEHLE